MTLRKVRLLLKLTFTMLVIIPYKGNQTGLAQLLVAIQPQLQHDDDIYILDMSKDNSALRTAKLYGSTRCYILVEPTNQPYEKAVEYGLEYMKKNKHQGALVISDRCVISNTLIANLKRATKNNKWTKLYIDMYEVLRGIDMLDPNFVWFNTPETMVSDNPFDEGLHSGHEHCYYINATPSNLNGVGLLTNEKVCVLPDFLEGLK
jgi:hypothetical protein